MLQYNFQFYKIKIFFLRAVNKLLIPFFVKNKKFSSLCFLLKFNLTKIKKILPKNTPKYKVLVLSKTGGVDDLIESQKNNNKNILYLDCPRIFFKYIYRANSSSNHQEFIKNDRLDESIKANSYFNNKEAKKFREKHKKFLFSFIKLLKKKYNFDAFIGFNYDYYAEKSLHEACRELKIPFLLLFKESVMTESQKEFKTYVLKKKEEKLNVYKIAVYSKLARNILTDSGIFKKKRIEIVGCSRLNISYSYKNIIPKNQILYYAIEKDRGLPNNIFKKYEKKYFSDSRQFQFYDRKFNWKMLHKKTLKILKKFAIDNPNIPIIIKSKIGDKLDKNEYKNLPKNIKLFTSGTGQIFLKNSKVVIGWNTTAILEGIAANRFMLLPYFFKKNKISKSIELKLNLKKDNYGFSESDFYKKLDFFNKKNYKKNKIYNNSFSLEYYLGNSSNNAGQRLNNFLKNNLVYNSFNN